MKKTFCVILFILIFTFMSQVAIAFDDMPNDWSTPALQSAVDNGLLSGYNNKLNPTDPLTRSQMASIIVRALGGTKAGDISTFTDVDESAWYYNSMAIAYEMGIFSGDGSGKLNPDKPITRQEAFSVLARAFSLSSNTVSGIEKFSDADDVAPWARNSVEALVQNGYVSGSNGKLSPLAEISRAEFAQVMYTLVESFADTSDKINSLQNINGNVIIRTTEITDFKNITIKGDLIIGDSVKSGFSLKNVRVEGRVVVRTEGDFTFDGVADELVIIKPNTKALISSDTTIKKITIVDTTSSFEVEKKEEKPPVTPPSSDNDYPVITPPTEDDIPQIPTEDVWTDFH